MELTGEHRIPAPREVVWQALNDPDMLKDCITGCQRLVKTGERTMEATVQAKVGPVRATFEAKVEIVNPEPPERYTLSGEGKGGVAGFAKGSADVHLAEDGRETILTYHAKATVGGKLAQLGSRLVDTTAKKYAADFFEAFSQKLAVVAVTPPVPASATPEAAPEPLPHPGAVGRAAAHAPAPPPGADVSGRIEPSVIEEGIFEEDLAMRSAVDGPHAEDVVERRLEAAAARGVWGGPWSWGILAFAGVILLLIAFG